MMRFRAGLGVLIVVAVLPAASAHADTACPNARADIQAIGVDAAEAAAVCVVNEVRGKRGLAPFVVDAALMLSARRHSDDMTARNYFDHDSPGGPNGDYFAARNADAGYPRFHESAAENLTPTGTTAAAAIEDLLNTDDGHCQAIMSPRYVDLGIGVNVGSHKWTMEFGRRWEEPRADQPHEPEESCPLDIDGRPTNGSPIRPNTPGTEKYGAQRESGSGGTSTEGGTSGTGGGGGAAGGTSGTTGGGGGAAGGSGARPKPLAATLTPGRTTARARLVNQTARSLRIRVRVDTLRVRRVKTITLAARRAVTTVVGRPPGSARAVATVEYLSAGRWVRVARAVLPAR